MSVDELELKRATSEATTIKPRGPGWRGFAGHLSAALLLFPRNETKRPSGGTLSVNLVAQPSSTFFSSADNPRDIRFLRQSPPLTLTPVPCGDSNSWTRPPALVCAAQAAVGKRFNSLIARIASQEHAAEPA